MSADPSATGAPGAMGPPGMPRLPQGYVLFGPKGNCTLDACPLELSIYGYQPSLAANYTFIALYALSGIIHTYLGIRWKSWWFMGCMIAGAINAIAGYIGRIMLHSNPFSFIAFMLQIICITTGPVYYCAAIYITLALAVDYFNPTISRFNPKLLYWVFIPCDIVSLILQGAGGGLSTSSAGANSIGVDLGLAGMGFQVVTIVVFCAAFIDYVVRYRAYLGGGGMPAAKINGTRVKLFFGFMAFSIVLILIRCVYRLVELKEGYRGELVREEPLFIGLEGVMVISAVYCLMVGHPGFVFKNRARESLGSDQLELQNRVDGSSLTDGKPEDNSSR